MSRKSVDKSKFDKALEGNILRWYGYVRRSYVDIEDFTMADVGHGDVYEGDFLDQEVEIRVENIRHENEANGVFFEEYFYDDLADTLRESLRNTSIIKDQCTFSLYLN